jgi:hypothetical protein
MYYLCGKNISLDFIVTLCCVVQVENRGLGDIGFFLPVQSFAGIAAFGQIDLPKEMSS